MRRGFTLVEVLVVVTILPFIFVILDGVYATFIRDVPRATRVLQVNTTVLDLLQQVRRDVEGAVGLPEQFAGQHANEHTLLIEQPARVICYQIEEGQVVRTLLSGAPLNDTQLTATDVGASNPQSEIRNPQLSTRHWRAPDAVITWRPWMRDGKAYALEVHSHVPQRIQGMLKEKLATSQVFFLHCLAAEDPNR